MDRLRAAGVAQVVAEVHESSLMMASHALVLSGVPPERVSGLVRGVRDARYGSLRGFFHGASDQSDDLAGGTQVRLHSVTLPVDAFAVGKTLQALGLIDLSVEVTAVRRRGQSEAYAATAPAALSASPSAASDPRIDAALVLQAGDVLVLKGAVESVALAEARLLAG